MSQGLTVRQAGCPYRQSNLGVSNVPYSPDTPCRCEHRDCPAVLGLLGKSSPWLTPPTSAPPHTEPCHSPSIPCPAACGKEGETGDLPCGDLLYSLLTCSFIMTCSYPLQESHARCKWTSGRRPRAQTTAPKSTPASHCHAAHPRGTTQCAAASWRASCRPPRAWAGCRARCRSASWRGVWRSTSFGWGRRLGEGRE